MEAPLLAEEERPVRGAGKEELGSIEDDFAFRNNVQNAHVNIRMAFIRKVYGLLSIQLLITFSISAVFMLCEPVKLFLQQNVWMMLVCMFGTFILLIPLHLKRQEHPTNLILLCTFTTFQAVTVGTVVSMVEAAIVLQALFITMATVIGLTAYTFQTKRDFSFMGAGLYAALFVLITAGFLQIFIRNSALEIAMAVAGVLVFSLYIIYDTQMLLQKLSPEEYVPATIILYLDILNLFLYILRILMEANRR